MGEKKNGRKNKNGIKEILLFGSCLAGACLGFLLFNLHPSRVFMGDTGSLFLGGAVAAMALYLKIPLLLIIIAIIPVIETISVMIQVLHYKRTGNRVFKMAPIHHHFELSGWSENKVVSVFSIVTLIACIIGLYLVWYSWNTFQDEDSDSNVPDEYFGT